MDEENTDHMVAYQDKKTVDQLNDDNYCTILFSCSTNLFIFRVKYQNENGEPDALSLALCQLQVTEDS